MEIVKITADIKDIERLLKRYPEATKRATIARITEALLLLEGDIKAEAPVGAGPIHLRDTIFHKVERGEPIRGLVGTPAIYGLPVERGTRPHFPPLAPIQHWVERKLGVEGEAAKSVAFLIARAISRRGTKGAEMFQKTFQRDEARVLDILRKIPEDVAREVSV